MALQQLLIISALLHTGFTATSVTECPTLPPFDPSPNVDLVFLGSNERKNKPLNDSFHLEAQCFYDSHNDFQAVVKFIPESCPPSNCSLGEYRKDNLTVISRCNQFEVTMMVAYEKPKGFEKLPEKLQERGTAVLEDFVLDVLKSPLNGSRFSFVVIDLLCSGQTYEGVIPGGGLLLKEKKALPEIYLWVLLAGIGVTGFGIFLWSKCCMNRGGIQVNA